MEFKRTEGWTTAEQRKADAWLRGNPALSALEPGLRDLLTPLTKPVS